MARRSIGKRNLTIKEMLDMLEEDKEDQLNQLAAIEVEERQDWDEEEGMSSAPMSIEVFEAIATDISDILQTNEKLFKLIVARKIEDACELLGQSGYYGVEPYGEIYEALKCRDEGGTTYGARKPRK